MYFTNRTYYDFLTREMPLETLKWLDIFTSDLTNRPFGLYWLVLLRLQVLQIPFVLTWKTREFDLCFGNENVILIDVNTAR